MASTASSGAQPSGEFRYPGSRLGLPEQGSGSVASWARRFLALFIDWIIAGLVASAVTSRPLWAGGNNTSTAQLVIFFAMSAILSGLAGATIGHRICGLRVGQIEGNQVSTAPVGLLKGAIRSGLICLLIPAVVFDTDRRGLHDRAANTVVLER
ncbi:RDD family protein [Kribbella deserti]|uniref:RDD family protein n=1 Tax=Kribbella deserti TaxID=1926257 RepID=A0ABV6QXF1_9ACTN